MSSRGRKQSLVEAVLTASFRPDRQGRLLLDEVLPASLPITGGDAACAAWGALVEAQERYRDRGAPDPWSFATLVRRLHGELSAGEVTPEERFRVLVALRFGPWKITTSGGLPWGVPTHEDESLRAHWQGWARFEEPAPGRAWGDGDWAVWRFERGLEPVAAFRGARRIEDVRAPG